MNQHIFISKTLFLAVITTTYLTAVEKISSRSIWNNNQKELANLLHKYPSIPQEPFKEKPFHTACKYQAHDIINFFIQHNVTIDEKIYLENHGYTALDIACIYGHASVVKRLLEHGATISIHSSDGKTPLHNAAYFGHNHVLQLLLMHDMEKVLIDAIDYKSKTPLNYALLKKNRPTADLLIYHGASLLQFLSFNPSTFTACMRFIATCPNCIHKKHLKKFAHILKQQKLTPTQISSLLLHITVHNQKALQYPHNLLTVFFLHYKHAKTTDSINFLSPYLPQALVTKIMYKSPYFISKKIRAKNDCTLVTYL